MQLLAYSKNRKIINSEFILLLITSFDNQKFYSGYIIKLSAKTEKIMKIACQKYFFLVEQSLEIKTQKCFFPIKQNLNIEMQNKRLFSS